MIQSKSIYHYFSLVILKSSAVLPKVLRLGLLTLLIQREFKRTKKIAIATVLMVFTIQIHAQQPTQTIRGTVVDQASKSQVPFATVVILGTSPLIGTTTDATGNFVIPNVPIGRYDVQVTYIGYEPLTIPEIIINSAKQTYLTVELKENTSILGEVVVTSAISKEQPLNSMATLSARQLSVEEAKRYAGGFDDPARLASSFAGVAGNTGDNGIIVRGNAPKSLQWKMEGVEIPNPNHFGDLATFGGGVFTALSGQMLANSDFFTGAFPAEYNNALSGVFDINMRTGNNEKREHTLQAGIVGMDVSSEGPFRKGGKASYLFNYRYSTFALLAPVLPEGAASLKYQDLSFKLNFPTQKAGIFSVWGIGLADKAGAKAKADTTEWKYSSDKETNEIRQYMASAGVTHKYFFKNNAFLKTTLASTENTIDWKAQEIDRQLQLQPKSKIASTNLNFILSSALTKKFSARHTNKTGILVTGMMYDILLNQSQSTDSPPLEMVNADGFSTLISGYTSSSINLTDKLVMNAGLNSQIFTLNNHYTIEPRLGLRQKIRQNQSVGLAYGIHSRLEKINYYFNNSLTTGEQAVNKDLDFSKAHHFVASYDWNVSNLIHIKVEPYFQKLFSVPVIADSSFSFINLRNELFFAEKLENTGEGRNYGLDLTFEKYMSKGYYYLVTASVYNSEYKGGDGVWRNTRFNRNYVVNFLIGKEWQVGKDNQNVISVNTRFSYQGGARYSPVNETASQFAKSVVYDETQAYSGQADAALNIHFTASYKVNKKHSSRELALKILNVTKQPDFNGYKYNMISNQVDKDLASILVPNLSYKVEF
jgi:hypothetical protein